MVTVTNDTSYSPQEINLIGTGVQAKAYVNNYGSSSVSVIDVGAAVNGKCAPIKTIPAPPFVGPGAIMLSRDHTKAYVGNYGSNTLSVIDTVNDVVKGAPISVGSAPFNIALLPNGTKAYVTDRNQHSVSVVDVASDLETTKILVGSQPAFPAIRPDGTKVYVTNQGSGTVSVINTTTDSLKTTIPVGSSPFHVAFTPNGSRAYVVNQSSASVSVIDAQTDTRLCDIPVGGNPRWIAMKRDSSKVYVSNFGSSATLAWISAIGVSNASVCDPNIDKVTKVIGLCGFNATFIQLAPAGNKGYVSIIGSPYALGDIAVFDVSTETNPKCFAVGNRPGFIAFTPDGAAAVVSNENSASASVIDVATDTQTCTVPVQTSPADIAIK